MNGFSKVGLAVLGAATVGAIVAPMIGQYVGSQKAKKLGENHQAMVNEIDSLNSQVDALQSAKTALKPDGDKAQLDGKVSELAPELSV